MTQKQTYGLTALGLVGVGVLLAIALMFGPRVFGASINEYKSGVWQFGNGIYVGLTQELSIDNAGNIITSGTLAVTGAITGSGALTSGLFTQGGGVTATSTTAAVGTLQTADIDTENVIDFTVNVADVTLTLAASTTPICPSTVGQMRSIFIRNASTTASADITIAGGTGVLLKKATSTATIYGDTDGGNYARLDITKKSNTDCEALLNIFMD